MTRWKLTLEYEGSGFCGWQLQRRMATDKPSVQQVLEDAVKSFSGEVVGLHVAGRTDAGVHAKAQVAHFDLQRSAQPHEICGALNFFTRPHPVVVLAAEAMGDDFHARFSATSRSYRYTIINRSAPLALALGRAWHVREPLDLDAMRECAAMLLGTHDFSTFRAAGCQASSPWRTMDVLDISREGEVVTICAIARSFLYHQVRNIVGTLVLVGMKRWSVADFRAAFTAAARVHGGPTAPACGLCLWDVGYDGKPTTGG